MAKELNFPLDETQMGQSWWQLETVFDELVEIDGYHVPKNLVTLVTHDGLAPEKVCAISDLINSPDDYRQAMGGREEFLRGERDFESHPDYQLADEIVMRFQALYEQQKAA